MYTIYEKVRISETAEPQMKEKLNPLVDESQAQLCVLEDLQSISTNLNKIRCQTQYNSSLLLVHSYLKTMVQSTAKFCDNNKIMISKTCFKLAQRVCVHFNQIVSQHVINRYQVFITCKKMRFKVFIDNSQLIPCLSVQINTYTGWESLCTLLFDL